MRTVLLLATAAAVLVAASLMRVDSDSTVMLCTVAFLAGLATYRPRWLRLKYAYDGDQEASRFAAAVMAGLFAVVFGALVGWRLTAIHRARVSCANALSAAQTSHNRILVLEHTVSVPLADTLSCGVLLEK